ncbi:hypothetical protein MKZ38_010299 [Zalerion maritima]|uniref:Uncharacterized protein n=1 Tax=Zalerion maritima TaxID=339359 RepID=A0AAD5RU33_9PEZI|nr:hypothetical protein MKZ38_010299 [Zalerion maritima]
MSQHIGAVGFRTPANPATDASSRTGWEITSPPSSPPSPVRETRKRTYIFTHPTTRNYQILSRGRRVKKDLKAYRPEVETSSPKRRRTSDYSMVPTQRAPQTRYLLRSSPPAKSSPEIGPKLPTSGPAPPPPPPSYLLGGTTQWSACPKLPNCRTCCTIKPHERNYKKDTNKHRQTLVRLADVMRNWAGTLPSGDYVPKFIPPGATDLGEVHLGGQKIILYVCKERESGQDLVWSPRPKAPEKLKFKWRILDVGTENGVYVRRGVSTPEKPRRWVAQQGFMRVGRDDSDTVRRANAFGRLQRDTTRMSEMHANTPTLFTHGGVTPEIRVTRPNGTVVFPQY